MACLVRVLSLKSLYCFTVCEVDKYFFDFLVMDWKKDRFPVEEEEEVFKLESDSAKFESVFEIGF